MGIQINTNVSSLAASNRMGKTHGMLQKTMSQLASGKRVNGAADDAAALAIMNEMDAQIRGLSQAQRNTLDGVSMIQTADGAMEEMSGALIRMRELAIQSGNGTLNDEDRANIDAEMQSLRQEIDRIAGTTEFNGQKLLDGSQSGGVAFQVGTGATSNDQISVEMQAMDSSQLGTETESLDSVSADTAENSLNSLQVIDAALQGVSSMRSDLGAAQNHLDSTSRNLAVQRENLTASKSRIGDLDVAEATMRAAQEQILMQSSTAVMAQANKIPAMALNLIG